MDENAEANSPPSPVGGVPEESGGEVGGVTNLAENGDEAKQEGGGDAGEQDDDSPAEDQVGMMNNVRALGQAGICF